MWHTQSISRLHGSFNSAGWAQAAVAQSDCQCLPWRTDALKTQPDIALAW